MSEKMITCNDWLYIAPTVSNGSKVTKIMMCLSLLNYTTYTIFLEASLYIPLEFFFL